MTQPVDQTKIYEVDALTVMYVAGTMAVTALGQTNTTGWTSPMLVDAGSSGDVYRFDFVATPPSGTPFQRLTPVAAFAPVSISSPPSQVIVSASTNSKAWQPK
jgi:hypothetical protein